MKRISTLFLSLCLTLYSFGQPPYDSDEEKQREGARYSHDESMRRRAAEERKNRQPKSNGSSGTWMMLIGGFVVAAMASGNRPYNGPKLYKKNPVFNIQFNGFFYKSPPNSLWRAGSPSFSGSIQPELLVFGKGDGKVDWSAYLTYNWGGRAHALPRNLDVYTGSEYVFESTPNQLYPVRMSKQDWQRQVVLKIRSQRIGICNRISFNQTWFLDLTVHYKFWQSGVVKFHRTDELGLDSYLDGALLQSFSFKDAISFDPHRRYSFDFGLGVRVAENQNFRIFYSLRSIGMSSGKNYHLYYIPNGQSSPELVPIDGAKWLHGVNWTYGINFGGSVFR